jgi:membrane-associated HD superfamily phosphohydrolase
VVLKGRGFPSFLCVRWVTNKVEKKSTTSVRMRQRVYFLFFIIVIRLLLFSFFVRSTQQPCLLQCSAVKISLILHSHYYSFLSSLGLESRLSYMLGHQMNVSSTCFITTRTSTTEELMTPDSAAEEG